MIGAIPCTEWLPSEIERDEKGFIKTGSVVAKRAGLEREQTPTEPARDQPSQHFCGRRCPLRFGQTLCAAVGEGGMAVAGVQTAIAASADRD